MRANRLNLITTVLASFIFFSCTRTTEEYQTEQLSEYLPLKVGNYITYRLDSTVFTRFGADVEIHSYQEKHIVDAEITDAMGRPSYRILRFTRDTLGIQPWKSAGSYFITPSANQVELVENNMRFIKLHLPIKKDFSWKGNTYLGDNPFNPTYSFLNDDDMASWEYAYSNLNDLVKYKTQNLDAITVSEVDEKTGLDTVDVAGNRATIPFNSDAVWLRGNATDTIIISASQPTTGHEILTIFNRSNAYASFNKIAIPPSNSLYFEYANGKWYYPNSLTVASNKVTLPSNASLAYIFGTATDSIKVDVSAIDTFRLKNVMIYNKSNFDAYANFNSTLGKISIPPGYGRRYELSQGQWRLYENTNSLLDKDPYSTDLPFGSTNYSIEKYAKGVGLAYQELLMWEYQPPNAANPAGSKTGFGVKRTIIDHN